MSRERVPNRVMNKTWRWTNNRKCTKKKKRKLVHRGRKRWKLSKTKQKKNERGSSRKVTHYEPCLMSPYNNLSNSFGMKRERWREVKELSKREEWHKRLKNRLSEHRWKRERNRFVNWSSWLNSAQIINQNESVLFLSPSYSLFSLKEPKAKFECNISLSTSTTTTTSSASMSISTTTH